MAGYACKTIKLSYICNPVSEIPVGIQFGSIAQLVQSVCLTSRGSGVRLPLLPLEENDLIEVILFFLYQDTAYRFAFSGLFATFVF